MSESNSTKVEAEIFPTAYPPNYNWEYEWRARCPNCGTAHERSMSMDAKRAARRCCKDSTETDS